MPIDDFYEYKLLKPLPAHFVNNAEFRDLAALITRQVYTSYLRVPTYTVPTCTHVHTYLHPRTHLRALTYTLIMLSPSLTCYLKYIYTCYLQYIYINRDIFLENPNVTWNDVVGLDNAKRLMNEAVVMPLKYPQYAHARAHTHTRARARTHVHHARAPASEYKQQCTYSATHACAWHS